MRHYINIRMVSVVLAVFWATATHAQSITISAFGEDNPVMKTCELVMTEAYSRLGRTMDVIYLPAERALVTANLGEVDGELGRTKAVEQGYPNLRRIPIPIATIDIVVFTKDTVFPVEGWESLRPYRVGHVRGIKVIEQNLAEGTDAETVETLEQAFKKLADGRNDVVVDARFPGLKTLNELSLKDVNILEPPLVQIELFHYLNIENQHLIEPLAAMLQQMENEGRIRQIQKQVEQSITSAAE